MNQQQWDAMSPAEVLHYLETETLEVVKQQGIPADSKVGDAQIITVFFGVIGGVTVTEECGSVAEVYGETAKTLRNWEVEVKEPK